MLTDEILKALVEGIIYVAPEPVTLDGILKVLEGEERERVKAKLEELVADYEQNSHGIQIRQVANGYKFSTKAEHHEILRKYVKSLKPPVRLSKPALETLAVIAYRQPVTIPEIEEVRGVDSGGVIHTLLEKKLVVTSGRKSVVGRPILYRTSKDFLVHFGLKDVGELPSLKEFEELAKRALGAEWAGEATLPPSAESAPAAGEAVSAPAEASSAAAPAAGTEAEPAAADEAPATPPETPSPAAAESASFETPATIEAPLATSEEAAAVIVESAVETPQKVSPPFVEGTKPIEDAAATEAKPAERGESGAIGIKAPPVPPPEPEPFAAAEMTTQEEPATPGSPGDSSDSEVSAPSADISPPANAGTASASYSTRTPEDYEAES